MSITPESTPSPARSPRFTLRNVVLLVVPALLLCGGVYAYFHYTAFRDVGSFDYRRAIRLAVINPDKLDEGYTDADGDLLADVPRDPAKIVNPDTLVLGTLEQNLLRAREDWKEFLEHLARITGKKVDLVEAPLGGTAVAEQIREGKIHVAMVSTGAVPLVVNKAGFIPRFVLGDDKGNFAYQMEILVAANSPIRTLADLKGKTLTLGSMSSLSSFKAPVLLLWQENRFSPDADYQIQIASGQRAAILGLFKGQYQVIAVANDYYSRVVREEKLDPASVRSLYRSESYPPFCIGHAHNLKPELQEKINEAFRTFVWKGTGLEKAYRPASQSRFVEVSYRKDWATVRAMDRAILELVGES